MKITSTSFEGLLVIEPKVFDDSRGYFYESYNKKSFYESGIDTEFVQDNQSSSRRGVLRGLHFQKPPFAQTKLIRVLSGVIQDVVVDLRRDQSTFGKHYSIELSLATKKQLLVPKGFAHGFLVLSEMADVLYKCDTHYHPELEGGIRFNDKQLKIGWTTLHEPLCVAVKDLALPEFSEVQVLF